MSCPVNLRALPTGVLEEVFTPENIRGRPMTNSLTTLSFPKSRCALWDGTRTGDKVLLHLCAHRNPRVLLLEKTLRLAQRHVRHSSKTHLQCFFLGSLSVDSDEEGVTVTLDRFDPGRDQNGARVPSTVLPGDVLVPCFFTSDPNSEALVQSDAELQQTFKVLQHSLSSRQSLDLSQILKLRLHVVCSQRSDSADFSLSWSSVSPAASVHVEPVRAMHMIPTALLRSLTSPGRPTRNNRQKGFVTMDQTRKLLLLLESDPKACSLPLVGLWFSGATHVHSPQIWAWTLRFLYSSSLQDRVFSESGCFLLVLFGSTHRAPQFFQCKVSGPGSQLDFQLLTGHHRTTLYQQVATVEGQTLKCDLSSETKSRQTEVFRRAQRSFNSAPAVGLSVTDQDSGVEDEDLSPRPSPSPHLPAQQARRIQPSVPELSLLIDGSFSSNHDPRPQAPPPPPDRKSAPPPPLQQLHSTPHSNLQPNCACCCTTSNNYNSCTTIHATPGPNQPLIHQKTPQSYQQTTPIPQNIHQTSSGARSSPSSHRQSPSRRRQSLPSQPQSQQTQKTPPGFSSYQHSNTHILNPLPQQLPASSPSHQTPISTPNVHPASQNSHPSPTNPAQTRTNLNYTMEHASNIRQGQLQTPQLQQNPSLNLFQTPQNVSKMHNPHLPVTNVELSPQNLTQTPPFHCTNLNFAPQSQHNSPSQASVPPFSGHSPMLMPPSWPFGRPSFPALPPPPVACANPCCEQQQQQGALSSGEAYQLLLQQDRQLRLLQQQVQMLLEAQGKLQSAQQQTESQTKSTASIAVGTGASLFWPEPPPLCRDASSSPPPPPPHSVTPVRGAVSPPHSCSPHSRASPPSRLSSCDPASRLSSCDQPEFRPERDVSTRDAPCSPPPSQNSLSSVESPVLGESASMYSPQDQDQGQDQGSFYHNLMTQLNSRLRESDDQQETQQEVTKSKQEEEERRRSLPDRPQASPSRSSLSSHSSSSSAPASVPAAAPGPAQVSVPGPAQVSVPGPAQVSVPVSGQVSVPVSGQVSVPVSGPVSRRKRPSRPGDKPGEDPVVSATLRRLQQLGVNLDKQELSEADRTRTKALESASTLAYINPAAVVSRLSVPGPSSPLRSTLAPLSHSSADLSLEANAIALRYLSDQQLTRLSLAGHAPTNAASPASSSNGDVTILSPNNMSLATRKYMRRYGLIEEESEEDDDEEKEEEEVRAPLSEKLLPQSQLIRELKPKMQLLAGKQNGGDEEKENGGGKKHLAVENQGSVGNILDLSRLRQLPKLF